MSALACRNDAAAFALGAVSSDERVAFERLLGREPALAQEVEAFARVAALLALAAPPVQPPPHLRARVVHSRD